MKEGDILLPRAISKLSIAVTNQRLFSVRKTIVHNLFE